jgi:hypothetical protein
MAVSFASPLAMMVTPTVLAFAEIDADTTTSGRRSRFTDQPIFVTMHQ